MSDRFEKTVAGVGISIVLLWFLVIFLAIGGWIANIVKLIGSDFDPLTVEAGLRVFGVVLAPLGAIMGYL